MELKDKRSKDTPSKQTAQGKRRLRLEAGDIVTMGCPQDPGEQRQRQEGARTAMVAKRLVFRLSRISKMTQLRAQSVTSRRPKGPRVIPIPLGSPVLQKNQRRL
ncbi:hypothetical protein Bca101_097008 [Brassica carinata]